MAKKFDMESTEKHLWGDVGDRDMVTFVKHVYTDRSELELQLKRALKTMSNALFKVPKRVNGCSRYEINVML